MRQITRSEIVLQNRPEFWSWWAACNQIIAEYPPGFFSKGTAYRAAMSATGNAFLGEDAACNALLAVMIADQIGVNPALLERGISQILGDRSALS